MTEPQRFAFWCGVLLGFSVGMILLGLLSHVLC